MSSRKQDPAREERIDMEIVVDCYDEGERFMGWFCYLEEHLQFPFHARCTKARSVSPLKEGEEVEVIGLIENETDSPTEMLVKIRWQDRTLGVPLVQLRPIDADPQAKEAIADWHYWCDQGYQF